MRIFNLYLLCLASIFLTQAQVGINTTTPDPSAILDIMATDKGILIPRVSLNNVNQSQLDGSNNTAEGMLIYNTNSSVTGGDGIGFYLFSGGIWTKLLTSNTGTGDADWFARNTTNPANDITDDIYTQGAVNIGNGFTFQGMLNLSLSENSSNNIRGLYTDISNSGNGNITGSYVSTFGNGGNSVTGDYLFASTSGGAGTITGTEQELTQDGNGRIYGVYREMDSDTPDDYVGIWQRMRGSPTGEVIGFYNNVRTNGGNPEEYGIFNLLNNTSSSVTNDRYGIFNDVSGSGSGDKYGLFNDISSGGGTHYGVYNFTRGFNASDAYGTANIMDGGGTGDIHGSYNFILNSGTGDKYGSYNRISTTNGTNYGVYSQVNTTAGDAGYFLGDVYISGVLTNPSARFLKTNINTPKPVLEKLLTVEVKKYDYKTEEYDFMNLPQGKQTGFIAEDFALIFPELVKETINPEQFDLEDQNKKLISPKIEFNSVNYIGLIPTLVKGIQEQHEIIKIQEERVSKLEKELEDIKLLLNEKGN